MSDSIYLFVYGTLRPPVEESQEILSFNYPKILPFLRGETRAYLDGADLYDLGSFPAAIPGTRRLTGIVLELDPEALTILDPLEGHPDIYRREKILVETETGRMEAWIYWAPEDLAHTGELMKSGDWLEPRPGAGDSSS